MASKASKAGERNHWLSWRPSVQLAAVILTSALVGSAVVLSAKLDQTTAGLLLLVVIFPFLLMMTNSAQKLLLAIIIVEIPIQLDTYLFFNQAADSLGALPGLNISLTTFCLVVLYALWFAELLTKRTAFPADVGRLSWPMVIYVGAVSLSMLAARNMFMAFAEPFLLFQTLLLFIYVLAHTRTADDVVFIVTMLLVALLLASVFILAGAFIGESTAFGPVRIRVDIGGLTRVGGTVGSPNGAGGYISLLLPVALGLLFTKVGRWQKLLALLAFCIGCVALLLTYSRGAWMAFAISLVVFGALSWYRGWLRLTPLILLVAAGLAMELLFHDPIMSRIISDDNGAAMARVPLMLIAKEMIIDHPFLGVGANNSALVLPDYITPEFKHEFIYIFHNKYLLVLAEAGPLALAAYLWFLGATIYRGWRAWQVNDPLLSPIALGLTAGIVGQMAHMFAEIYNGRPLVQMQWLCAALIAALWVQASKHADLETKITQRSVFLVSAK